MTRQDLTVGNRTTSLHLSASSGTPVAGVVVLHPWWGLNDDVVAYADRLADAGFAVAAPDLYEGRLATTIEEADRLATSLEEDVADAFALASVDALGAAIGDPMARLAAVEGPVRLGFQGCPVPASSTPVSRPRRRRTVRSSARSASPRTSRSRRSVGSPLG